MITFDEETQEPRGWLIDLDHAKYHEGDCLTIADFLRSEAKSCVQWGEKEIAYVAKTAEIDELPKPDDDVSLFLAWLLYAQGGPDARVRRTAVADYYAAWLEKRVSLTINSRMRTLSSSRSISSRTSTKLLFLLKILN